MKKTKLETIEQDQWRTTLMKDARRLVNGLCKDINQTVPVSVEGMRYARQFVLEEVIKLLEAKD